MWEQQLQSMLDDGYADLETFSDFGVAYTAETGDSSLIDVEINTFSLFVIIDLPPYGPISRSRSRTCTSNIGSSFSESTTSFDKRSWSISRKGSNTIGKVGMAASVSWSGKQTRYGSVTKSRYPYGTDDMGSPI